MLVAFLRPMIVTALLVALAWGPASRAQDRPTADPPLRVGRIAEIDGRLNMRPPGADDWVAAERNFPVAAGTTYSAPAGSRARLDFATGQVGLNGGSELHLDGLDERGLKATLPAGEAYFHLRASQPDQTWLVRTPRGVVSLDSTGRYAVRAGDAANPTRVTVLEGAARVLEPGPNMAVPPGQAALISGADAFSGELARADTDAFIAAMEAADPAGNLALQGPSVVAQLPGGLDLARYGAWDQADGYGSVWYPQVAADWAPYRDGRWSWVQPWGWTWNDDASWGFATSHYGRWAHIGGRWGWLPGPSALYAPAMVSMWGMGFGNDRSVGWAPLRPGEHFHPWYHASDRYRDTMNSGYGPRNAGPQAFEHRPGTTVVPMAAMTGSRNVAHAALAPSPAMMAGARPFEGTAPMRPTQATWGVASGSGPAGVAGPVQHIAPAGPDAAARHPMISPTMAGAAVGAGTVAMAAATVAAVRPGAGYATSPGAGGAYPAPQGPHGLTAGGAGQPAPQAWASPAPRLSPAGGAGGYPPRALSSAHPGGYPNAGAVQPGGTVSPGMTAQYPAMQRPSAGMASALGAPFPDRGRMQPVQAGQPRPGAYPSGPTAGYANAALAPRMGTPSPGGSGTYPAGHAPASRSGPGTAPGMTPRMAPPGMGAPYQRSASPYAHAAAMPSGVGAGSARGTTAAGYAQAPASRMPPPAGASRVATSPASMPQARPQAAPQRTAMASPPIRSAAPAGGHQQQMARSAPTRVSAPAAAPRSPPASHPSSSRPSSSRPSSSQGSSSSSNSGSSSGSNHHRRS